MKKAIIRCTAVTAFVFLTLFGVSQLGNINLFSAFDPISQALAEFSLTDYVFSNLRPLPLPDERIVLVNLGPNRAAIGQQIRIISQHKPKVIGIDGYFNCEGGLRDTVNCPQLLDTLGNLLLSSAIQDAGNVVLVSRLLQSDSLSQYDVAEYDTTEFSDPMFSDHATNAFANLVTNATYQEDIKICKSFVPKITVNGKEELAFSVRMVWMYDSVKAKRFLDRNNEEEIINFRGNFEIPDVKIKSLRDKMSNTSQFRSLCFAVDWDKLLNGEFVPSMFENSIVIMGSLGDYFGDPSWEDKFFTPLNSKVAGRANPDMFGVVVHANAVAMMLNEDYVNEIPQWLGILIAIIVCFLNVGLFRWVDTKFPIWFDGLSVIIQIVEIILTSLLIVMVFAEFNLKLDLTLTIATMALVGPCFDIFKSFENVIIRRLTIKPKKVLTPQNTEIS